MSTPKGAIPPSTHTQEAELLRTGGLLDEHEFGRWLGGRIATNRLHKNTDFWLYVQRYEDGGKTLFRANAYEKKT